ncbi:hypothetical protein LTR53_016103, partial [Teratosphaeriaceae sp. CCFEE 6253]
SKLVACFIRADADAASTEWEEEWLADLAEVITEKAVLLRLDHGGAEAGFLGAFCKVEKAPMVVVIQNGRVLEKLEGGVGRDEFVERLLRALGLGEDGEDDQDVEEKEVKLGDDTAKGDVAQAASALASAVLPQSATSALASTLTPDSPPSTPQAQPPSSSQDPSTLFPDRAARLAADKAARDKTDAAAKQARADARRKEAEDAHAHHRGGDKGKGKASDPPTTDQRARASYLSQQKERNAEAKLERARILAQIEADKANRRARRTQPPSAAEDESGASVPLPPNGLASSLRSAGASGSCALQIRLFDGSALRGRFPASQTLGKDVRAWVREQAPEGSGGADIPYTFRRILAPQPSRSIEVGEEGQSLGELGLVPSATLVLVPIPGAVSAYAGAGAGAGGWAAWPSSLLSSAYGAMPDVGYYLPSFSRLYMGGVGDEQEASNVQGGAMAGADSLPNTNAGGAGVGGGAEGRRTRTLFDQRVEAERKGKRTEFYNGNSSAFEGRKDDKDGEGKAD